MISKICPWECECVWDDPAPCIANVCGVASRPAPRTPHPKIGRDTRTGVTHEQVPYHAPRTPHLKIAPSGTFYISQIPSNIRMLVGVEWLSRVLDMKERALGYGRELKYGLFIKNFISKYNSVVSGCHDISEGGIILALAELAIKNRKGLEIETPSNFKNHKKWFFCEDQSRYILIVKSEKEIKQSAEDSKIKVQKIATVIGDHFNIINKFEIPIKKLINYNNKWFEKFVGK